MPNLQDLNRTKKLLLLRNYNEIGLALLVENIAQSRKRSLKFATQLDFREKMLDMYFYRHYVVIRI